MRFKCTVCLDFMEFTNDGNVYATRCGHVFHFSCIAGWLESRSICPQCREFCSHYDIYQLFLSGISEDEEKNVKPNEMFEYMESKITDLLALLSERDEKLIKIEKIVEQIDFNFNEFLFKDQQKSQDNAKDTVVKMLGEVKYLEQKNKTITDQLELEVLNSEELKLKLDLMRNQQDDLKICLDVLHTHSEDLEKRVDDLSEMITQKNNTIKQLKLENNFLKNQLAENSIYWESDLLIELHEKMNSFETVIQSLKEQNNNYLETIQLLDFENSKF